MKLDQTYPFSDVLHLCTFSGMHSRESSDLHSCAYSLGALLYGANEGDLTRLQRLQNRAVRLIYLVAQLLRCLHWLPIRARINFKLLVIVFKCIHSIAPSYLQETSGKPVHWNGSKICSKPIYLFNLAIFCFCLYCFLFVSLSLHCLFLCIL